MQLFNLIPNIALHWQNIHSLWFEVSLHVLEASYKSSSRFFTSESPVMTFAPLLRQCHPRLVPLMSSRHTNPQPLISSGG